MHAAIDTFKIENMPKEDLPKFVKLVELRPCLYDTRLQKISGRSEVSEAWKQISTIMNAPVRECKDKWRKLRISYARSLKMQSTPYYLCDQMKFLNPFLKVVNDLSFTSEAPGKPEPTVKSIRSLTENTKNDISPKLEILSDDEYDNSNTEFEYLDDYVSAEEEEENLNLESGQSTSEINVPKSNINEENNINRLAMARMARSNGKLNVRKRRRSNSTSLPDDPNPRQMFVLSLMPDINAMTEEEMRSFRRQIVNCIDNIYKARENS